MEDIILTILAGAGAILATGSSLYAAYWGGPKRYIHLGVGIAMLFFLALVYEELAHPDVRSAAADWFVHVLIALFFLVGVSALVDAKERALKCSRPG